MPRKESMGKKVLKGAIRTAASVGLFVGSAGIPTSVEAQEPAIPKTQIVQVEGKGHDVETEFKFNSDTVSPRIEIFDRSMGDEIVVIEGLDGVGLRRVGITRPLSIGNYEGTIDLFGYHDGSNARLNKYGFGINTHGKLGDINLTLIGEFNHQEMMEVVPYGSAWMRFLDKGLARHQQRLERLQEKLRFDIGNIPLLDPMQTNEARNHLERLADRLGIKKNVNRKRRDNTYMVGLRLGTSIDYGTFTSEPNLGLYVEDGRWTINPVYVIYFGEEQRSLFGIGTLIGGRKGMNLSLGRMSKPGNGWTMRLKYHTNFDGTHEVQGTVMLNAHPQMPYLKSPVDWIDEGDFDIRLITNPMDFQVPEDHNLFSNILFCEAGYTHTGMSGEGPREDSLYVRGAVHPVSLYELLTGETVDDVYGLLHNFHIGGEVDYTRSDGRRDITYLGRIGTALDLNNRGRLEIYGEKREGEDYGAFMRMRISLGK